MTRLAPSAILFDLGSTLIEYEPIGWDELSSLCIDRTYDSLSGVSAMPHREDWHAWYLAFRQEARQKSDLDFSEWVVTDLLERMLQRIDGQSSREKEELLFEQFYAPVDERLTIYADTLDVLARLRQRFSTIGLISNTIFPEHAHRRELKRFGIEPFLDFSIFSSTFGRKKPHPEIFLAAASQAGVEPSECVYIGDRYLQDIVGPTSVGMPAILRLTRNRDYPDPLPPDLRVITTLTDLQQHLDF